MRSAVSLQQFVELRFLIFVLVRPLSFSLLSLPFHEKLNASFWASCSLEWTWRRNLKKKPERRNLKKKPEKGKGHERAWNVTVDGAWRMIFAELPKLTKLRRFLIVVVLFVSLVRRFDRGCVPKWNKLCNCGPAARVATWWVARHVIWFISFLFLFLSILFGFCWVFMSVEALVVVFWDCEVWKMIFPWGDLYAIV